MNKNIIFMLGLINILGVLFFDISIVTFIVLFLCIIVEIVFSFFASKIENKILYKTIKITIFIITIFVIYMSNTKYPETGANDFKISKFQIEKLLDKEKWEEAIEKADALIDKYRVEDSLVIYKAMGYAGQKEYVKALNVLNDCSRFSSKNYFQAKEVIYLNLGEEYQDELFQMYIDAANIYPDWIQMWLKAGISQLELEQYNSAKYYLEYVYEKEPYVGEHSYYLGVLHYYMGNYEIALNWFDKALENNDSEEWEPFIQYFTLDISEKIKE